MDELRDTTVEIRADGGQGHEEGRVNTHHVSVYTASIYTHTHTAKHVCFTLKPQHDLGATITDTRGRPG